MGFQKVETIGYRSFLKENRNFHRLWWGGLISLFGDGLNHVATVLLMLSITDGSGLATGLVIGARFVLKMLCSNIGGVFADRYDRKSLLIVYDLIMAGFAACYLFVDSPPDIWLLFVISTVMGGTSALFATTRLAYIPDIVGTNHMTTAIGLNQIGLGISMLIGCAAGGAMVGFLGFRTAFIMNMLTFVVSAAFTRTIEIPHFRWHGNENRPNIRFRTFRDEFCKGLRYLKKKPFLLKMMALNTTWAMGGGGVLVVVSMLNYQRFGNSEQILGTMYAMIGVGALMASAMRPWIGKSMQNDLFLLGFCCLLEGTLFILLILNHNPVAVVLLFAVQMSVAFVFVLIYEPLLLNSVSCDMRGRVIGFENGLFLPTYGLSSAIYGSMLNYMDLVTVGLIGGSIMSLSGLVWLIAIEREHVSMKNTRKKSRSRV